MKQILFQLLNNKFNLLLLSNSGVVWFLEVIEAHKGAMSFFLLFMVMISFKVAKGIQQMKNNQEEHDLKMKSAKDEHQLNMRIQRKKNNIND